MGIPSNRILPFFLGIIVVYWMRGIRFWEPQARSDVVKEERGDWSFWVITVGMIAAFYLPPAEYLYFNFLPSGLLAQILGLFLVFLGSVLFILARRTLGQFYSGHVSVLEGQPLVQSGPYHFIRHPAYAGYLFIALGIACGYSSVAGLVINLIILLPAVIYRIHVEDKLLAEYFGAQFESYASRTKRLLPLVW